MASKVQITNRALTKIGEQRILSMSDDVEAARSADSMWDILRDNELRARNWNFSISRTSLAALASTPSFGFDYEYQMPSDCLRVIQVGEYFPGPSLTDYRSSSDSEYQIEGRKILTNEGAPLYIRYISRVENTGEWDAAFVEVFSCRLAVELAERLTQSTSKRQLAWEEYQRALQIATRSDAIENPPEYIADSEWVLARL